jgi:hypothetical protein
MYGYYFSEITARPIETPYGGYRGGYVPAIVDPFIAPDAAVRNEKEALTEGGNSFMFPTTGRGFTKSRIEAYAKPLALDLRYLPQHIDKVLRFVHIEPHVKDAGRILFDRSFRDMLNVHDPAIAGDMLVPWLQRAATQKVAQPGTGWRGRAADAFFRELRTRTSMQILTANVINSLQQLTGFSISAVKVQPRYLRSALWTYMRGPRDLAEEVNEQSEFMRTRTTSAVIEAQKTIEDLLLNPSKYAKLRDFILKHGYFMTEGTQSVVDLVTWSGAYDQAIANGAAQQDAVRQADSVVRETQGSFAPEDLSTFETGRPFVRAFTMFYSYFNMQANLLGTEFVKIARDMGLRQGAGRALYVYTMAFMIPAVLAEAISQAAGGFDVDDDDSYLDDIMRLFFGAQFRTAAAMVPGGSILNVAVNKFNDKSYDDDIRLSPAVTQLESAASAPASVYRALAEGGSAKKAVRDVLTLVGLLTGLPFGALGRPLGYAADVMQGNVDPESPAGWIRGLVSGRSGSGS